MFFISSTNLEKLKDEKILEGWQLLNITVGLLRFILVKSEGDQTYHQNNSRVIFIIRTIDEYVVD